jgi:hypothetical protein
VKGKQFYWLIAGVLVAIVVLDDAIARLIHWVLLK